MLCSWGCHRDSLAGEDCTQGSLWRELYPYCRTERRGERDGEGERGRERQGETMAAKKEKIEVSLKGQELLKSVLMKSKVWKRVGAWQ